MSADDEGPIELFIVDIVNAVVWVDVCGKAGGTSSGCVEDDPEAWSIIVGKKGREKSCGHSGVEYARMSVVDRTYCAAIISTKQ